MISVTYHDHLGNQGNRKEAFIILRWEMLVVCIHIKKESVFLDMNTDHQYLPPHYYEGERVLKVEPNQVADRLDLGCERQEWGLTVSFVTWTVGRRSRSLLG